ncbi:MAG: helix-turn-helix domain-containing protein [Chloroflexota bacterium]
MDTYSLATSIRRKKLGVLLRNARLTRHKDLEECAQAIGVSPAILQAYELGERSPSLPEVELLAYYLDVSLEHFLDQTGILHSEDNKRPFDPQQLLGIRQRVIGIMLRKARTQAQLGLDELAEKTDIPTEQLNAYEIGQAPVPLPDLEALALALNLPVREFQDLNGPVGGWFLRKRVLKNFQELSPELQAFIAKPVNRPYLELAQRLSEMDVEKLRTVAEGLLEITL